MSPNMIVCWDTETVTWDFQVVKTTSELQDWEEVYTRTIFGYYDTDKCKGCGKSLASTVIDNEDDTGLCVNCYYDKYIGPNLVKKCECGSKKAGDIYHAHWCPVYVSPMAPRAKSSSEQD